MRYISECENTVYSFLGKVVPDVDIIESCPVQESQVLA